MLPELTAYINDFSSELDRVSPERKMQLDVLAAFIRQRDKAGKPSNLIFICTHNSRRSHMAQLWAQAAAYYYRISNVYCFSGGTEATAFNPRSVRALQKAGFEITRMDASDNPVYRVRYAHGAEPVTAFSKTFDDPFNAKLDFAAVMTCSDADETCPHIPDACLREAIPYDDPKQADDTPEEEVRYDERCRQIAEEMFYLFSQVNQQK